MPNDDLSLAANLAEDRRTVAGFFGAQRPPKFFAGELIECDRHAALPAGQTNQFVAIDERMSRKTPQRRLHFEIFFELS